MPRFWNSILGASCSFGIFMLLLTGCKSDFDLIEIGEPKIVVIGLLNPSDEDHYIRILKAFGEEDEGPLRLAQDPDQLYFGVELEATVSVWDDDLILETFPLDRIDGNSIGLEKLSGIFENKPNILYHFKSPLVWGLSYRLDISNAETGESVWAEHRLIEPIRSKNLESYDTIDLSNPRGEFSLDCEGSFGAKVYDMNVAFCIEEDRGGSVDTQTFTKNLIYFQEVENLEGKKDVNLKCFISRFHSLLFAELEKDIDVQRNFVKADLEIWAAGEELWSFYLNSRLDNFITSHTINDDYSNVQGGYGIWSSRSRVVLKDLSLSNSSLDSLSCSAPFRVFNFKMREDHPFFPLCP